MDNLVFANSRSRVEQLTDHLRDLSERTRVPNEFFAHSRESLPGDPRGSGSQGQEHSETDVGCMHQHPRAGHRHRERRKYRPGGRSPLRYCATTAPWTLGVAGATSLLCSGASSLRRSCTRPRRCSMSSVHSSSNQSPWCNCCWPGGASRRHPGSCTSLPSCSKFCRSLPSTAAFWLRNLLSSAVQVGPLPWHRKRALRADPPLSRRATHSDPDERWGAHSGRPR